MAVPHPSEETERTPEDEHADAIHDEQGDAQGRIQPQHAADQAGREHVDKGSDSRGAQKLPEAFL